MEIQDWYIQGTGKIETLTPQFSATNLPTNKQALEAIFDPLSPVENIILTPRVQAKWSYVICFSFKNLSESSTTYNHKHASTGVVNFLDGGLLGTDPLV